MMISKIDPLADALELLREVHEIHKVVAKDEPMPIGCFCRFPEGKPMELCVWCRIEVFLEMQKK